MLYLPSVHQFSGHKTVFQLGSFGSYVVDLMAFRLEGTRYNMTIAKKKKRSA